MADGSSEAVSRLRTARGFIFDMDGTLVLGDRRNQGLAPLPGALELTRILEQRRIPFVMLTNGTTRPPGKYVDLLRRLGFPVADNGVVTPASSAARLFVKRGYRRVVVLGGDGLAVPLADAGIEPVRPEGCPEADAVLVGWYREFNMDALEAACHAVWNGAKLYSSSQSLFFATAEGRAMGTSRAISAMISSLTGCRVSIVGKPSMHALRCAAQPLAVPLTTLAVVGDDPALEVAMAHRGGALAVLVDSGGVADETVADRRPDLSVRGVDELLALYLGDRGL
jgi:HAD superfamily hydrolase (TIGR01450 family)